MTSPVTKAMIESYALMIMVMGTFFVYFCMMVWAFCNPKLSGAEEDCDGNQVTEQGEGSCVCGQNYQEPNFSGSCAARLPSAPLDTAEGFTRTTYVNFWDDTDSLLSDCTAFCREDKGLNNQLVYSPSWTA